MTPDPNDPALPDAFDHNAIYSNGEPTDSELDTGLRCWCGREVVSTIGDDLTHPSGWAHVGIGDASEAEAEETRAEELVA